LTRKSAIFFIILGASLMSFVGVLMRILETQDVFLILFYRSIGLSIMVLVFTCLRRKQSVKDFFNFLDTKDLIVGLCLAITFIFYVFAMIYTSVASALFIISAGPFLTAIISWFWINEKPKNITWLSMFIATVGVLIMLKSGNQTGNSFGNFCALVSALSFSIMLVYIRKSKKLDVLGGTFVGALLCCVLGFFVTIFINKTINVSITDMWIIICMGAFTIGLGISLVTWSASYLPAPEVSLFMLTESVLGPIWPWLFLSEKVTLMEMFGGVLILFSLLLLFLLGAKRT
jgi:DME family drug/metabolite transporter|tara:strand:- start:420 stop:1283 length:864 start_codon:yes stop_codon:yes gene_type:complete